METLIAAYFFALLLFGISFSKAKVIGPLYLHDCTLGLITLLAINNMKRLKLRFIPVLSIVGLSIGYLIFSLLVYKPNNNLILLTFRQFNLFLYLFCSYVLFNTIIAQPGELKKAITLLKHMAITSMLLQVVYILFGFLFIPNFFLFQEGAYNYFSPLVIFGIITYGGHTLAHEPTLWKRFIKFFFCILLSTTLGHASAFFALFVILIIYFFIRIKPYQRLIAIGIIVLAASPLFFLPQFTDVNAGWRLLYWKHVLQRLVDHKYLLFGFGFGQPYMTSEYAVFMFEKLNSHIMMDSYDPIARYVSPPHNSFVTIAFHIGLLPFLLLLVPLKKYFGQLFLRNKSKSDDSNFLIYALTGCVIWVSFNVILELPHSAIYFWLVYFTTIYHLNTNTSTNPDIYP